MVYNGGTERKLRERITEHLRDVRLRKEEPINSHFGGVTHGPGDLTFAVQKYGSDFYPRPDQMDATFSGI